MKGLVYGVLCLVLGILSFIYWWGDFISIIKGLIPAALITAGLMALSTGVSMIKGSKEKEKNNTEK